MFLSSNVKTVNVELYEVNQKTENRGNSGIQCRKTLPVLRKTILKQFVHSFIRHLINILKCFSLLKYYNHIIRFSAVLGKIINTGWSKVENVLKHTSFVLSSM